MKILFLVLIMSIPTLARADLSCTFERRGHLKTYEIKFTMGKYPSSRGQPSTKVELVNLYEYLPRGEGFADPLRLHYATLLKGPVASRVSFLAWDRSISVNFDTRAYKSLRGDGSNIIGRAYVNAGTWEYSGSVECKHIDNYYKPLVPTNVPY